jgi:hypothetical protein
VPTDGRRAIRPYQPGDKEDVVALWARCGLTRPWNDPRKDIARKLAVSPDLFLVADCAGRRSARSWPGTRGTGAG